MRAVKTATPLGTSTPVTTYFLDDGDQPVLELNAAGQVTAATGYGADGPRQRYQPTESDPLGDGPGVTYQLFYDMLGNTNSRFTSGAAARGAWSYDQCYYTPYGTELYDYGALNYDQAPAHTDPFGFGGQYGYYTDNETGLVLLGHRYYDPGTGRFVTRDFKLAVKMTEKMEVFTENLRVHQWQGSRGAVRKMRVSKP